MIQQCRRKVLYLGCFPQRSTATSRLYRPCRSSQPLHCRRILGMLSLTVEAADNLFANSRLFRRISRRHHALCQSRQLVSGQLSLGVQLVRKTDHAQLLFGVEPFNFFDDLSRCHTRIVSRPLDSSKTRITRAPLPPLLMPRPRVPGADTERSEHDFHGQRAKDESHYTDEDGRALSTDHL